jgi:hypothetical protein
MRCRNGKIRNREQTGSISFRVPGFEFRVKRRGASTFPKGNSKLETRNPELETFLTISESWESRNTPLLSERTGAAVRVAELPLL